VLNFLGAKEIAHGIEQEHIKRAILHEEKGASAAEEQMDLIG